MARERVCVRGGGREREAVNLTGWGGEYTVHYMLEVLTSSCKKRK